LGACGASPVGSWRSADGKVSLQLNDKGYYYQWDTQYPVESLKMVDPSNSSGAKIRGPYSIQDDQLTISATDGIYPNQAPSTLTSIFSIGKDTLWAPDLVHGVSNYDRVSSAP
jgi:hypothetical protein